MRTSLLLVLLATAASRTIHVRDVASLQAVSLATPFRGTTHLILDEGEYELSSTLVIPTKVTLRARAGHEVTLRLAPFKAHPVLLVRGGDSVLLRNLRVIGHSNSTTPVQHRMAVEVLGGTNHTLDRLTVTGGVMFSGGSLHTLTRSRVSNPHGAAHGNCVYFSQAGDPRSLTRCNHTVSHTEIHDCRGLGDPWPSNAHPCHPKPGKPCPPDPYPNITGNGVLINQVIGSNISHNFVHDVNYHGTYTQARIHSRFPDPGETPSALNVIELNHIKDFGQCADQPACNYTGASGKNGQPGADPGCIYFFDGPLCCYGQKVVHNFCHNTKRGMKGLYLDGDTSGIETYGNVLYNISGNIIDNNDGHDNHHFGNLAINGHSMGSLTDCDFWGSKGGPFDLSSLVGHTCTPHFWDHYQNYGTLNQTKWVGTFFDSPTWKRSFPQIQSWWRRTSWVSPDGPVSCDPKKQFTDCCMFPTGTTVNYSVMVNTPAGGTCSHNLEKYCSWNNITNHYCGNTHAFDAPVGCWPDQAKFQTVGPQKLYTSDPGFVDMSAGNFALKSDSRIFTDFPGFPPIPFADIGPRFSVGHLE